MGKLWSQRATSALPRPGAAQAIGICHVAIATRAVSKPVCRATLVIRTVPASSNRHSWPRGFLPRGLYDAHPSWSSGGHWHAYAGGHPTNLNDSSRSRQTAFRLPVRLQSDGIAMGVQTRRREAQTPTGSMRRLVGDETAPSQARPSCRAARYCSPAGLLLLLDPAS